jgi:hypothetical protein
MPTRQYPATARGRTAASRLAAAHTLYGDSAEIDKLRRNLRFAQVADHLEHVLRSDPPLTADQVRELAALLAGEVK